MRKLLLSKIQLKSGPKTNLLIFTLSFSLFTCVAHARCCKVIERKKGDALNSLSASYCG